MINIFIFLFTCTLIGLFILKVYYEYINKYWYFIALPKEDMSYKAVYDWYIKEIVEMCRIPEEYFK